MKRLETNIQGFTLYKAGLPQFPRNFSRDSIISGILMQNPKMLSDQLSFCAKLQGRGKNPSTGEEPGKIFHEYPGVEINGYSTLFNACDTTAMFLIAHEVYQTLTGDKTLAKKQEKHIERAAIEYILPHIKDDLFIEDPGFSGAEEFGLSVTYWKDSEITGRENGKPKHPVVYTLAHVQNAKGLRSAAKLLGSRSLKEKAEKMIERLKELYDEENGGFYIGIDSEGRIKAKSSDSLHVLFYLEKEEVSKEMLEGIVESSVSLETSAGYRTLDAKAAKQVKDKYHAGTVWPFEQAIINSAARKHGLKRLEEISSRVMKYLDTDPELFVIEENRVKKGGCDPQLWTIGAKEYFRNQNPASLL
ncbi:MAG: hypothetical protein DRP18_01620 [Candidatus Aenigmatarchaeota archaeon]|nr:MAG: hypothetical protein DRP18_01620 [Candidatus Aenigmarchaeota archaeon]